MQKRRPSHRVLDRNAPKQGKPLPINPKSQGFACYHFANRRWACLPVFGAELCAKGLLTPPRLGPSFDDHPPLRDIRWQPRMLTCPSLASLAPLAPRAALETPHTTASRWCAHLPCGTLNGCGPTSSSQAPAHRRPLY